MFGLLGLAIWANQFAARYGATTMICQGVFVGIAVLLLLQTVSMYKAYYRQLEMYDLETRQRALSVTTMSVLLEAAKAVHPTVLEQLFRDRARRWGLVSGTRSKDRSPYSTLHARPRVTDRFIVHFLKMSNEKSYMPKNMLSDKDTSFDPAKFVTAYEMYDDFESLLMEELKATRPYGWNKPGFWLAGWNPDTVAADFGVDLEVWNYEEDQPAAGSGSAASDVVKNAMKDLVPLRK
jgi:hypothetical protein